MLSDLVNTAISHIVFGWHLDGPSFPETPSGQAYVIDEAVVGPLGLLNLLEANLGINGPGAPAALRIAQYWARLRAIDDGDQFFSPSLEADGWATARLLLTWRDELVAAGWVSDAASWHSERLASIARAEARQEILLSSGISDRARSLLRCVSSRQIERLTLVDNPEQFPLVWRQLIDTLAAAGTEVVRHAVIGDVGKGDLGTIQSLFSGGPGGYLAGDGSLAIVRCDDELLAADITAEWLAANPEGNANVVIIRQGDATVLDAACHRLGLPKPGGSEKSPFRGALQALPLAFETTWEPLDAGRLLELLVMSGSPIPYRVGRRFANVLRDFPGSGGARWQAAWELAAELARERHSGEEFDDAELAKKAESSIGEWRKWLEPARFARHAGMPAQGADSICRRVQSWALRRAEGTGDPVYRQTANAAAGLAETISASGLDPISKPQIDRMIDAVIAEGIARPGSITEAAPWTTVDQSSQVWGQSPAIVWWGFTDPGLGNGDWPWTEAEQAELRSAGMALQTPEDVIALHVNAQRRAILNATDRALLVMPTATAAEPARSHPIWHEIATLEGVDRVVIDGRSLRQVTSISLNQREWNVAPVNVCALPRPIRDWFVSPGTISAREMESATSLESLIGCPMNWVLQYSANIRESALLDMADDNRLKGNVAHEVLARFFGGQIPDDEAGVRESVSRLLEDMLPEIGAPLLLPGRLGDREEIRRNTIESAVVLFRLLRNNSLSVTATERQVEVALDEQSTLSGSIDLELADNAGRPVIVDLKWSNSDRYRREEIEQARAIQLATYAQLLKSDGASSLARAAYFMMKQQRLLAVNEAPFPPESRISGSDLGEVWAAILTARRSALDDLKGGTIVATGIAKELLEADDVTSLGSTITVEPPCRVCPYGRLCGERPLS